MRDYEEAQVRNKCRLILLFILKVSVLSVVYILRVVANSSSAHLLHEIMNIYS